MNMDRVTRVSFIVSVLLCTCIESFSQVGGIVSAPILEAQVGTLNTTQISQTSIMTAMNTVMENLERADKEYKQALQKATWLRNLQTAQRILYMVENLVCTTKDLSIRVNSIGHNSCLVNYRFDMSIIKVQQSADYLGIILTAGVTMSPGERMKSLDDVIKSFAEAQEMMVRLNRVLDSDMMRLRLAKSTASSVDLAINYDRSKKKR